MQREHSAEKIAFISEVLRSLLLSERASLTSLFPHAIDERVEQWVDHSVEQGSRFVSFQGVGGTWP